MKREKKMFEAELGLLNCLLYFDLKGLMSEYGNFSDRLRQARESAEMSVFQAAQFVNVSPGSLSNWEKANLASFEIEYLKSGDPNRQDAEYMPSYVTVHSLAMLYGVDLDWLVSGIHSVNESEEL